MEKVAVIGAGYVGLVTASCLAELGNKVICVDNDAKKITNLKKNIIPIYEPGLKELIVKNKLASRLLFGTSIKEAVKRSRIVFICVATPAREDGSADLSAVENVSSQIAKALNDYKVIVEKSTVPAETGEKIRMTIEMNKANSIDFDMVSNPEFLREGQAIGDTFHPDRIVLGVESDKAEKIMRSLFKPIHAPVVITNIQTAEIIKHASNSFLATKISFINAVASLCEKVGADVEKVADAMGLDKRIGRAFLNAGCGFGGSCFPKDLDAFIYLAQHKGYNFELLKVVRTINQEQKHLLVKKVEEALWIIKGKQIALLGLSFKPNTDDIRCSVGIELAKLFSKAGARLRVYDPQAMGKARKVLKKVTFCKNAWEALRGSDCAVFATEWDEFKKMDLRRVKSVLAKPVIVDGRNMFDPAQIQKHGLIYKSVGRI